MDPESRQLYRKKVAALAARSDFTEIEVAKEACSLRKQAQARNYSDPRIARRESHIGYYLVGEGRDLLQQKISVAADRAAAGRDRGCGSNPDEFFLPGIAILTLRIITAILLFVDNARQLAGLILFSMLLFLLSQFAVRDPDHRQHHHRGAAGGNSSQA